MFYISQLNNYDCGFACFKMVLASLNKNKDFLYLSSNKYDRYSFKDLVLLGKQHQINFEGAFFEDKKEIKKAHKTNRYPFIISIEYKKGHKHAVVVAKAMKFGVIIYDPSLGKNYISYKKLFQIWDGNALFVKDFQKTECNIKFKLPINKKKMIPSILFHCFSSLFCMLGILFIDKSSYVFIPIIFFGLFCIFEILFRNSLFNLMKAIDQFYYDSVEVKKDDYYSFHQAVNRLKKSIIINPINLIFSISISIFLIVICILNGLTYLPFVLLCFVLAIFDVILIEPLQREKETKISLIEQELKYAKNNIDYCSRIKNLNEQTYNYGKQELIRKYVYIAALAISNIVIMAMSNIASVSYVIFFLCLEYTLFNNLKIVFGYEQATLDREKNICIMNSFLLKNEKNK